MKTVPEGLWKIMIAEGLHPENEQDCIEIEKRMRAEARKINEDMERTKHIKWKPLLYMHNHLEFMKQMDNQHSEFKQHLDEMQEDFMKNLLKQMGIPDENIV